MGENSSHDSEHQKEIAYYKKQLDRLAGENIRNDFVLSSTMHELKQKKEAFAILTDLQQEFSITTPLDIIFSQTAKAINAHLRMDRALILLPATGPNTFKTAFWYGFPEDQVAMLEMGQVCFDDEALKSGLYLLFNKSVPENEFSKKMQNVFLLNYFIGVPVLVDANPVAFIIAGRQFEKVPFILPLDKGDADTLVAIAGLISAVIQNKNMMELRLKKAEIEEQNVVISAQRDELEKTLNDLRKAQALLVQREKMASLGELTAGIAHEIQNPLNFVNNFSDVNQEMISELEAELKDGNIDEALAIAIDIRQNEEKINQHGKRADSIVKGMLQHSRTSTGERQLTDINLLADEFLKLSYHGLNAKNKNFKAEMVTIFDESLPQANIVRQDIGRVLLNLFNNAFYAVCQKQKTAGPGYQPVVEIVTVAIDNGIKIKVKDNGTGISEGIKEKIMQPFFTTKPTGEGTGLGLSISYDIVVKVHGGNIMVNSVENEYSIFTVQLPLK